MPNSQSDGVAFRVMPSGRGQWYWELIANANTVLKRGIADTEPGARREASEAARKLIGLDDNPTVGVAAQVGECRADREW
jgi:hypothetical protein